MNPSFNDIGRSFASHYYNLFDTKEQRPQIAALYHPTDSLLTFEGQQIQGQQAIVEKMKGIPLEDMQRTVTTLDCQPTADGGVLISVLGQLKNSSENDKVMGFSQTFLIKPFNNSFFIFHDIFRLVLHNI
ncbi:nuclear transport factor 2 [Plakobranchus ocellatus]|uniref:Nuclear transport factor 2 n=1 Tax=Plakobranchus ocellatus TaxID=259542 RepID=A0AAV3ZRT5_9GAST|nr:nuclear transport factor 2 [Plakobranchus ocellatus]